MIILRGRDGTRHICTKGLGNRYWFQTAELISDLPGIIPDKPPSGRIIIRVNERSWIVTLPDDDKGEKLPWVRCSSLAQAERMRDA